MRYILKKVLEKPFLHSKNNVVTEVNNNFINLTGYSNKELIGKSLVEISNMLRIDCQLHLKNIESEYSGYIFTKEHEPKDITITCKSLNCQNERAFFIKENSNSIVKERFDLVKQLYTDSKTGISIISVPDLILLDVNENYLNYFNEPYNKIENCIGKNHKEMVNRYGWSESEDIWNSVISTGKPYYVEEFQHNSYKRGVTYWNISVVPMFIEGKLKYITNKILDVTEKVLNKRLLHERIEVIKVKEAANEYNSAPIFEVNGNITMGTVFHNNITNSLRSEENLLLKAQFDLINSIIENVDVGVVRYSYPNYKVIYVNNRTYIDLKQINPKIQSMSSIIGQNYFDIFLNHKENDRIEVIQNLSEKKGGQYFINRKISITGEESFLKVIYKPLFGLDNQIYEIIVITIDITEEIKAKNKMEETLKIQDEMFSNISHELKTPLNVIFSTNQLMEFYLKNDSFEVNNKKVSKGINIIKQNCYRFTKIINNIIDISKIESGFFKLNLSNENIVNIIEDIVQSVSDYIKLKGLNIVFDTNTEEKIIALDPDKIERIILNIISNAIKFTNTNGSIFVNIFDKADTVEISIKDTGIGMDKMHLDNIFKRFHQVDKSLSRNAEGSGIGLSLVKSIVELHGGRISVESKPDKGSTFKIELPTRIIENPKAIEESMFFNNKIERINIEFSDIYSL